MKPRLEHLSTSVLRAMLLALRRRPWKRRMERFCAEIDEELLARELPLLAEESGGFPVSRVKGLQ